MCARRNVSIVLCRGSLLWGRIRTARAGGVALDLACLAVAEKCRTLYFRLSSRLDKVAEFSFGCVLTRVGSVCKNDSLRNFI